ncbi:putative mitochondrial protein [Andalucia godoyi]|uniref:Putative mitochondrial protein n=1 Tax=Andalucia godoyi TaxID=505711 RepID=A0A8K0AJM2_ANDGO|nr:putative mitochondrial protein [Andalucia godoyi]|eukprot:ANDGO_03782.mRNA.1 putative mitochondrial protein
MTAARERPPPLTRMNSQSAAAAVRRYSFRSNFDPRSVFPFFRPDAEPELHSVHTHRLDPVSAISEAFGKHPSQHHHHHHQQQQQQQQQQQHVSQHSNQGVAGHSSSHNSRGSHGLSGFEMAAPMDSRGTPGSTDDDEEVPSLREVVRAFGSLFREIDQDMSRVTQIVSHGEYTRKSNRYTEDFENACRDQERKTTHQLRLCVIQSDIRYKAGLRSNSVVSSSTPGSASASTASAGAGAGDFTKSESVASGPGRELMAVKEMYVARINAGMAALQVVYGSASSSQTSLSSILSSAKAMKFVTVRVATMDQFDEPIAIPERLLTSAKTEVLVISVREKRARGFPVEDIADVRLIDSTNRTVVVESNHAETAYVTFEKERDADVFCDGLRSRKGWPAVSSSVDGDRQIFEFIPPSPPPVLPELLAMFGNDDPDSDAESGAA